MKIVFLSIAFMISGQLFLGPTACGKSLNNGPSSVQRKCQAKWYDEMSDDARCLSLQKQLTASVVSGDPAAVRDSLDHGANVNGGHNQSIPVLEVAASAGTTDILKLLIEADAEINRVRPFGQTALKASVISAHADAMKVLIESGADVCEKTEGSALHYAIKNGDPELVGILEEAGARHCPKVQGFEK